MEFGEIFQQFLEFRSHAKVIFVGSSDEIGQPNCAPKMLIDIAKPNKVFYVDFKASRTTLNIQQNWQSSIAVMEDKTFTGYRLNGFSQVIDSGHEFLLVKEKWTQKVIAYEAERMIERIKGVFSPRPPVIALPEDFIIIKFIAEDASIVKPDSILRAIRKTKQQTHEKSTAHPIKKIVELESELSEHIRMERKLKERKKALERASIEDELTGLYNRRGFFALVDQQLKIARRSGKESFIIFSDLDRLKPINDTFGHQMGDQALVDTARILKKTFRDSDIVARIGGDEFAVSVIDCKREGVEVITNRLKRNIEEYNRERLAPYSLGLSVGVTPCNPEEPVDLEHLMSRADHIMYEEKQKKHTA